MKRRLIIGSRGSPLALVQARHIADLLNKVGSDHRIETIKTSGDKDQRCQITEIGGKGVFVKEIEEALISGKIDIAVHSLKDMPAKIPSGLLIGAYIKGEDARDVLISKDGLRLDELKKTARIGSSSPRRKEQLKLLRSDIEIAPIRGNVETRLRKVAEGEYDGTVLALAGLKRLGLTNKISQIFGKDEIVPAAGQGVIAVEARKNDTETLSILKKLDDPVQRTISEIEFGILRGLNATCDTPIGISSTLIDGNLHMDIFLSDGSDHIRTTFGCEIRSIAIATETLLEGIRSKWNTTRSI